jgi:ABC-type branched-subunit amino acid transport system substrate-binding protein
MKWRVWILLTVLFMTGCEKWVQENSKPTYKIGIMLPYTGGYSSDWDSALDWAVENINKAGGVAGRNIELVKKDIGSLDIMDVANDFVANSDIKAVIGPLTSSDVFKIAPLFITSKKVLMAPVATAANISRAFAGYKFFWRLSEPDISQMKTLILLAQSGGAHSVGLITEDSQYGASFEDWFGYFATELGLTVSGVTVIQPGDTVAARSAWNEMTGRHPDAVVAALNQPAQNAAMARIYRTNGQQIRLLFSDAACLPSLITRLGSLAENLEGTTITSDPKSGFDISYHARYNKYPDAFLATMYDAAMLISLALEASGGEGGEKLADALTKVVSGRTGESGWNRDDIIETIGLIKKGVFPDLKGASGSLDFDDLFFTDVASSTYGHWRIDAGQFVITDFYTSNGNGRISSTSAAYRTIAAIRQQFSLNGTWPLLSERKIGYAFLMATSYGWSNYRHQADVLQAYQLLKAKGIDDDHIILIMADDLASSPSNIYPGVVKNSPEGENLYKNVVVDYKLSAVTPDMVSKILTGEVSAETPVVLSSTSSDDIFIFTSGHGTPEGIVFSGHDEGSMTPEYWQSVFGKMYQKKNYRLVFWAVEACYSGKIGEAISTPGILLMTAANPYETSKSDFYDAELNSWLGDRFAYLINNTISTTPDIPFNELYERSFSYVNGSHVSFYNYQNFGNIYQLRLNEFVNP